MSPLRERVGAKYVPNIKYVGLLILAKAPQSTLQFATEGLHGFGCLGVFVGGHGSFDMLERGSQLVAKCCCCKLLCTLDKQNEDFPGTRQSWRRTS